MPTPIPSRSAAASRYLRNIDRTGAADRKEDAASRTSRRAKRVVFIGIHPHIVIQIVRLTVHLHMHHRRFDLRDFHVVLYLGLKCF